MSATVSDAQYLSEIRSLNWSRAITAGFIATIVITISLALSGMNIMKSLGAMMLPNASVALQYLAGGIFHFMVGLVWGVLYAWLFGRVREWGPFLKGTVYGLTITAVALAVMPLMAMILPGGREGAANPCSPCASAPAVANPCNPCANKAANPCNPCAKNACSTASAKNPCNPCGGGGQSPTSSAVSAINHLLFALTLAFVYRARPAS